MHQVYQLLKVLNVLFMMHQVLLNKRKRKEGEAATTSNLRAQSSHISVLRPDETKQLCLQYKVSIYTVKWEREQRGKQAIEI